jgi:hypothetical protein
MKRGWGPRTANWGPLSFSGHTALGGHWGKLLRVVLRPFGPSAAPAAWRPSVGAHQRSSCSRWRPAAYHTRRPPRSRWRRSRTSRQACG